MAYVHPGAERTFSRGELSPEQLINGVADVFFGLLHVWGEAIDPAQMPAGIELVFTEPRLPSR